MIYKGIDVPGNPAKSRSEVLIILWSLVQVQHGLPHFAGGSAHCGTHRFAYTVEHLDQRVDGELRGLLFHDIGPAQTRHHQDFAASAFEGRQRLDGVTGLLPGQAQLVERLEVGFGYVR